VQGEGGTLDVDGDARNDLKTILKLVDANGSKTAIYSYAAS